jgi:hypothetical protein
MIKKKEKEENVSSVQKFKEAHSMQKQSNNVYKVYVALRITSGGVVEEIASLGAVLRYKDQKPTLIITNSQEEVIFEEIRPDAVTLDEHDLEELEEDLEEVDKAIEFLKKKEDKSKKTEEKEKTENTYEGLYLSDWEAKKKEVKRKILHDSFGKINYVTYREGLPVYTFDLEGYYKIPVGNYFANGIISAPPVHKIDKAKLASQYLFNAVKKRDDPLSMLKWGAGLVIILVLIIGILYLFAKAGSANTESMNALVDITENLKNMTDNQKILFETYVPELNSSNVIGDSVEVIR